MHEGVKQALDGYLDARSMGPKGRDVHSRIEDELRGNLASLVNGKKEQIALMSNSSEAISAIALAMCMKPGENVVVNELEFPSGVLPWLRLKEQGVEVKVVPHREWKVTAEDMLSCVDEQTRMVVVSHVSYMSGARMDYRKLYRQIRQTRALLLVDITQSLGVTPHDISQADFLVSSSYKWLLSVHGAGLLAVNPERTAHILPHAVGWRSVQNIFHAERFDSFQFLDGARKFELGYPSYPTLYVLHEMTGRLLQLGIDRIERHILELGGQFMAELRRMGFTVMTPMAEEERAGNIAFACDDGEQLANQLSEKQIYVWGGDGRVRLSVHVFNDSWDKDRFVNEATTCLEAHHD